MKTKNILFAALRLVAGALLFQAGITQAAEIKLLSANGIKASVAELAPRFEKASGHKLSITYNGGVAIEKLVSGGESADVVIIPQWNADNLVKTGKTTAGAVTPIARSGLGVAMRKGSAKPDISSPEALKRTLLAAKSVAYNIPEGSGSGSHFVKVLDKLGIAKEMKPKTVPTTTGLVGSTVASGKAELGVTQISSLLPVAGIEVIGPLPGDLQNSTHYSLAILSASKNADAVKALATFLRNAEAAKVYKAKGMEPG